MGSDANLTGWGTVTAGYSFRVIVSLLVGARYRF